MPKPKKPLGSNSGNAQLKKEILALVGYKSGFDSGALELLGEIGLLGKWHPEQKSRMDPGPRAAERAQVNSMIESISETLSKFDTLGENIVRGIGFQNYEGKFLNRIDRRAFERRNLRYPPIPRRSKGSLLKRVIRPFFSGSIRDPFFLTKLILTLSKRDFLKLRKKYASLPTRSGPTKNAEHYLEQQLFKLFDTYCTDEDFSREGMIENEYVNRKAKFVYLSMKTVGVSPRDLGSANRGTKYSGRLGRAAFEHSKDPMSWLTAHSVRVGVINK